MKKITSIVMLMLVLPLFAQAQHATVVYNSERNYFNENQPLPAEANFVITGGIGEDISQVRVGVYRSGDKKKTKPLYEATWRKPEGSTQTVYSVPMNYKLRGGNDYSFKLSYFRNLSAAEREYLKVKLFQTLDAYLLSSLEVTKNNIILLKPYRIIMNDLNTIVSDGLSLYEARNEIGFDGFSDVVKGKIQQIEEANLNSGKFLFGQQKRRAAKAAYAKQLLEDLLKLTHNEVEQFLNTDLMTVKEHKAIEDYPVEKTQWSIPVNIGYGATFFDGEIEDIDGIDYDSSPFIGISLPLGRKAFSPFWSRTSISLGVFLNNMENAKGEEISGPIIGRPTYAGLGYKLFRFVRLNAGATFTEKTKGSGNLKDVKLEPFVGVSAEFNLSINFGD